MKQIKISRSSGAIFLAHRTFNVKHRTSHAFSPFTTIKNDSFLSIPVQLPLLRGQSQLPHAVLPLLHGQSQVYSINHLLIFVIFAPLIRHTMIHRNYLLIREGKTQGFFSANSTTLNEKEIKSSCEEQINN